MKRPRIASENEVLAAQRRASKEITQGLEDRIEELHALSARQRGCEFSFFAFLFGFGALGVYYSHGQPVFTLMGIVCMGVALNSLAIFMHEGLHGLLARNPRLNHLFSFLVGIPIMVSATAYHATHVNHHYELGRKLDYGTYRQHLKKPIQIWFAYFVQLFFGTFVYIAFIPFLAFKVASRRSRFFLIAEYSVIILAYYLFFKMVPVNQLLLNTPFVNPGFPASSFSHRFFHRLAAFPADARWFSCPVNSFAIGSPLRCLSAG